MKLHDENELLEAVYEGIKRWMFQNKVSSKNAKLTRIWSDSNGTATLHAEINDQIFVISINEAEE